MSAKNDKATPRPWIVVEGGNFVDVSTPEREESQKAKHYRMSLAEMSDGSYQDLSREVALANAALIVRAVNNIDRLEAALHEAHEVLCAIHFRVDRGTPITYDDKPQIRGAIDDLAAALAELRKEKP